MRRISAIVLLVLIGLSLASSALAARAANSLPACCLRNGKHHCDMPSQSGSSSGPALTSQRCSQYPQPGLAVRAHAATPVIRAAIWQAPDLQLSRISAPAGAAHTATRAGGNSERGPPSNSPVF